MTRRQPPPPAGQRDAGSASGAFAPTPAKRKRFPAQFEHLNTPPDAATSVAAAVAQFTGNRTAPEGHGIDSSRVRAHMVQQLRERHGISNALVLQAMQTVQRHHFVDTALATQAYTETSLPIGFGQTISKPQVVGKMVAALLEVIPQPQRASVLEIGTGCGYQCAVLAEIFGQVTSIERVRGLHELARRNLSSLHKNNIRLVLGDGMLGYPQAHKPFDGIISAAGGATPKAWLEQLRTGGRIVAPETAEDGKQYLAVIDRRHAGVKRSMREAVHFVPLRSGME